MKQAVALLRGRGLPPEDADENRVPLLSGFRWVLVDECLDVGPEQYELVAAIGGPSLEDDDERLGLSAVGDDDQNVYQRLTLAASDGSFLMRTSVSASTFSAAARRRIASTLRSGRGPRPRVAPFFDHLTNQQSGGACTPEVTCVRTGWGGSNSIGDQVLSSSRK